MKVPKDKYHYAQRTLWWAVIAITLLVVAGVIALLDG